MHIPVKLRFLLAWCVVAIIPSIWIIKKNNGTKADYNHVTGKLTYLTKRLSPDLPYTDFGSYRYVIIENYPYPFEVYTDDQGPRVDSLIKGDIVTAYFYETENTHETHINRFMQYLEKDNKMYFTQRPFMQQFGYFLILLILGAAFFFYRLYKAGKIPY